MFIVYDDKPQAFNGKIRIADMDPIKAYLKHYSNYLYLDFITKRSEDRLELHQARKELTICERKLAFWKRHPKWNATTAANEVARLKQQWQSGTSAPVRSPHTQP